MQKERNLFRIDTGNTHGWQVRIERNKTLYSKFFSDSLFTITKLNYSKIQDK